MINYELKFGVSEVAKILDVEKNLVEDWACHFSQYLNPKANPPKEVEREFSVADICTLGYISMYWEDEPDFENIKYGLNSNSQFEYPYSELAIEATPIFREFSEELIGGKVWMIGGMSDFFDKISLAESYKTAGDLLIDIGIDDETNREIIYPAIYNYRHATELYLKAVIPESVLKKLPKKGNIHNLTALYDELKKLLKEQFNTAPSKWFENIIIAFDDFDPGGTTFRYGIRIEKDEMFIDLIHLKKLMNWFSEAIKRINELEKK